MFAKLRQRKAATRGVEFCDACSRVCAADCRAHARLDRLRVQALYTSGLLR